MTGRELGTHAVVAVVAALVAVAATRVFSGGQVKEEARALVHDPEVQRAIETTIAQGVSKGVEQGTHKAVDAELDYLTKRISEETATLPAQIARSTTRMALELGELFGRELSPERTPEAYAAIQRLAKTGAEVGGDVARTTTPLVEEALDRAARELQGLLAKDRPELADQASRLLRDLLGPGPRAEGSGSTGSGSR